MSCERKGVPGRIAIGFVALLIALACMALDRFGYLRSFENWLYDKRAQTCQNFMPPPSDKLVYLCIGDESLHHMGRWPWDRSTLASIVDVLQEAGAKTIAFDILFVEPQREIVETDDGGKTRTRNPDNQFADAMKRQDGCVLPVIFESNSGTSEIQTLALAAFRENRFWTNQQLKDRLTANGHAVNQDHVDDWKMLRWRVMLEQMAERLGTGALPSIVKTEAIKNPMPHVNANDIDRSLELARTLDGVRGKVPALNTTLSITTDDFPRLGPVEPLASATATVGHVGSTTDFDGVNRSVNPWVSSTGRAYLQFGLAMACDFLDVPPDSVEMLEDRIVLKPAWGQPITLPLTHSHLIQTAGHGERRLRIPWRGSSGEWTSDYFEQMRADAHSMLYVYNVLRTQRALKSNDKMAREAMLALAEVLDPTLMKDIRKPPRHRADRTQLIKSLLALMDHLVPLDKAEDIPADTSVADRKLFTQLIAARGALRKILELQPKLVGQLQRYKADLRESFHEKAVLIGWAASGTVDYHVTPLHQYCPGFIIHGTVFNAVMTGDFLVDAPSWLPFAMAAAMAMLLGLAWGWMRWWIACAMSVALSCALLVLNAVVIFDYHNVVAGLAGPLLVWMVAVPVSIVLRLMCRVRSLQ